MSRPIGRKMLREVITEHLIGRILDGTYPPGSRIVESQLAQEFGTSQAPVREALRDLEGMRFIESRPHVGARVREVTTAELIETYPVRAALEEVAARAAAPLITADTLAALSDELDAMHRAAEAGQVHEQLAHDARFHEIIVEAANNRVLLDVWRSLRVHALNLISLIKADSNLRMIAEMHRPVLATLEMRDPELAGKVMRAHIEFFASFVAASGTEPPAT